jgi:hypothetical protein
MKKDLCTYNRILSTLSRALDEVYSIRDINNDDIWKFFTIDESLEPWEFKMNVEKIAIMTICTTLSGEECTADNIEKHKNILSDLLETNLSKFWACVYRDLNINDIHELTILWMISSLMPKFNSILNRLYDAINVLEKNKFTIESRKDGEIIYYLKESNHETRVAIGIPSELITIRSTRYSSNVLTIPLKLSTLTDEISFIKHNIKL